MSGYRFTPSMEDCIASSTFLDGPYAFSLLSRRTRPSSYLNVAALEKPVSGRAAMPAAAPAPTDLRKSLRDVIIAFLTGEWPSQLVTLESKDCCQDLKEWLSDNLLLLVQSPSPVIRFAPA